MKKNILLTFLLIGSIGRATATDYYLSPTGSDTNDGLSRTTAVGTIAKAQALAKAGDTVYMLPGTYSIGEDQISATQYEVYKIVFNMNKSGRALKPISYIGLTEGGQRPVFDMSAVNPTGFRITAFLVSGSYLVFKNFEVTGIKVNITDHTQSENIRVTGGSYNTFENIACHDGMGIGFYLTQSSHHNLFVNCDGYNNYDYVSDSGTGGQNDGFGCHVNDGNEGNIFIGCRAWNNSDDGFDLINCYSPVTFCYSFAYKNGYDANGTARQDGNGFKAGGFGMSTEKAVTLPASGAPRHIVHHNIAARNRTNGFYTNHHLGGVTFSHNTAWNNGRKPYSFVNRQGSGITSDDLKDVTGYRHVIEYNLSATGSSPVEWLDDGGVQCTVTGNSFTWNGSSWVNSTPASSAFECTDESCILTSRDADGMLTATTLSFLKQTTALGYGADFSGYAEAIVEARKVSGAETDLYNGNIPSYAVKETRLWTFDQFMQGDIVSSTAVYDYGGLFISGHAKATENQAKVAIEEKTGIALNDGNTFTTKTRLDIAGTYAAKPSATSAANAFMRDCIALYTGCSGTLYVYASAAAAGRGIRIVVDGEVETLPNTMTGQYTPVLNSKHIDAFSNVFVTSTEGGWRLHAVKFVPDETATLTRDITMTDMGVMTFSSPTAWQLPAGLKAYTAGSQHNNATLMLTAVPSGIIPASTGVILEGTPNTQYTLTATDCSQPSNNVAFMMRPVLADYPLAGDFRYGTEESAGKYTYSRNNYILAKHEGKMVLAKSSGNGSVAAGKAYYSIRPDQVKTATASPDLIFLFGNGETTGVSERISQDGVQEAPTEYYNLAGQRVKASQKGIYICNGKKVIVK